MYIRVISESHLQSHPFFNEFSNTGSLSNLPNVFLIGLTNNKCIMLRWTSITKTLAITDCKLANCDTS